MSRTRESGEIEAQPWAGFLLPETTEQQRIRQERFARRFQPRRVGYGDDQLEKRPLAACAFGEKAAERGGERRTAAAAGATGAMRPERHEHRARRWSEARAGVGYDDAFGTGGVGGGGEADRQAVIWHGCEIVTSDRQGKAAPWPGRAVPLT